MSLLITFLLSLNFIPVGLIGNVDTNSVPDAVRNRGGVETTANQVRFNTNRLPDALRTNVNRRH